MMKCMLENNVSRRKRKRNIPKGEIKIVRNNTGLGITMMKWSRREDVVKDRRIHRTGRISRMIEGVVTIWLAGVIKRLIELTLAGQLANIKHLLLARSILRSKVITNGRGKLFFLFCLYLFPYMSCLYLPCQDNWHVRLVL